MSALPACPHCAMDNIYPDGENTVCADCGHEWPAMAAAVDEVVLVVRDANGTPLASGDNVVVIKELKVKGSSLALRQGTLIRNIRLVHGDPEHVEGRSDKIKGLVLKACFLKKA